MDDWTPFPFLSLLPPLLALVNTLYVRVMTVSRFRSHVVLYRDVIVEVFYCVLNDVDPITYMYAFNKTSVKLERGVGGNMNNSIAG